MIFKHTADSERCSRPTADLGLHGQKTYEYYGNAPVMLVHTEDKLSRLMTKPTKWHMRPAKTQISLGICPVWSVFSVRMEKAWVLSYPLSAQRRLWSDWTDAQADLSLRWAHMPRCWFCHEVAQLLIAVKLVELGIGLKCHVLTSASSSQGPGTIGLFIPCRNRHR